MTDEISILARYRPATSGPTPEATEQAEGTIDEFLRQQQPADRHSLHPGPDGRRSRPLSMAVLSVLLVAAGGVAIAVIGDGISYVGPATPITESDELTLVVQESNIGPCVEVRKPDGTMTGECGADLSQPLAVSVGSIGSTTFANGWAPPATSRVEMTFEDGNSITVTKFQSVDAYDAVFFLIPLPGPPTEAPMPIRAAAYDSQGNTLGTVTYDE